MDTVRSINQLRASFLRSSSDPQQAKRTIKPFILDNEEDTNQLPPDLHKLYYGDNGDDLLLTLESPPISENYMAKIESLQRTRFNQKKPSTRDTIATGRRPSNGSEAADNHMAEVSSTTDQKKEQFTSSNNSITSKQSHTVKPTIEKSTHDSLRRNGTSLSRNTPRPTQDPKTKKGALFSRIFKAHNSSDPEERKTTSINSSSKSSRHKSSQVQNSNLRFYDGAFNYDETLDDDEDDEDDDDDVDKNDEFFLGGLPKSDDGRNNKLSKLGHLPRYGQNALATSSGGKSNLMLNILDRNVDTSVDDGNTVGHSSRKDQDSDLDSYMDEDDLKELDLDEEKLRTSAGDESDENGQNASGQMFNKDGSSLSGEESFTSSELSSYGKSLLDSDINDLDDSSFTRAQITGGSLLEDSMITDELLASNSMPEHSVPRSHAFKLLEGSQQSAFINDSTPLKLNEYKKPDSSTGSSIRNSFQSVYGDKKGNLATSSPSRFPKSSTQANAPNGVNGSVKTWNKHRRSASDHLKNARTPKPTFDPSVFGKAPLSGTSHKSTSKLTSILRQKKNKNVDTMDYFSFVSGDQVAKSDSTLLHVYIQDSLKHRKHPLNLKVRKSATVFEVIGFILYQYFSQVKALEDGSIFMEKESRNPNMFRLKVVDEDGEPFEDNFGTIDRKSKISGVFDDEVVLCKVNDEREFNQNEAETPLPYEDDDNGNREEIDDSSATIPNDSINQLSYYKPILQTKYNDSQPQEGKLEDVKIFLFPNLNPAFNFTTIRVPISTSLKTILARYCSMKSMDPMDYTLKISGRRIVVDLDDSLGELDGNFDLELISRKEVKALGLKKMGNATFGKPALPTIQSADLTPVAMNSRDQYLTAVDTLKAVGDTEKTNALSNKPSSVPSKKGSVRSKRGLHRLSQANDSSAGTGGFFKLKNSSKSSLRNGVNTSFRQSYSDQVVPNLETSYKDAFTGAYYKYKVWRRQQISFINKHERTLAIDGDYIYIIPPENGFNWHHDHGKTKCFHMSQVVLIRKSKRIPEYFKIFVNRPTGLKRYYFEAANPAECVEIVSRIQSLLSAYRMDHRGKS
ncbi:LAFA_0E15016g1_1 [Lachancea sp. 'fantastica']|nr:LAFA_0E15016g1_1 [Lachancea sp. 'fantastica']